MPAWWKSVCSAGQSLNEGCLSSCAVVERVRKTPLMISVSVFLAGHTSQLYTYYTNTMLLPCSLRVGLTEAQVWFFGAFVSYKKCKIRFLFSLWYAYIYRLSKGVYAFVMCACGYMKASICMWKSGQLYGVDSPLQVARLWSKHQVFLPLSWSHQPSTRCRRLWNMENLYVFTQRLLSFCFKDEI